MPASYGDESPIAAFATLPGRSALTLIRCSGTGVIDLAARVFSAPQKLGEAAGNTIIHGWMIAHNAADGGGEQSRQPEKLDEVLVSVFRSPKSYTGEDSLDISCHGGSSAGMAVMKALTAAGFRGALPGEFTFRAFMNGKLDLTRSESVMELVSARTDAGRRRAIHRLSGALEKEISVIKQALVQILCAAEIFLDYSEDEIGTDSALYADDDEPAGRLPGKAQAEAVCTRLKKLIDSWKLERIYQEGVLAVIAGRPNAGKSSLFNLLLKEDRSIVTEIPGTTRDWIEAWVSIEGIPVRLADTAGLHDSADPIEKIGIDRSRELLETADIVLYLIDGGAGITAADRAFIESFGAGAEQSPDRAYTAFSHKKPLLVIWNKADLAPLPDLSLAVLDAILPVSAKTGAGLSKLCKAIAALITPGCPDNAYLHEPALGSSRQKNLVERAAAALEEALRMADNGEPLDLIAPQLREAVNALGEITGEVSTADILETMFSNFCVGK